MRLRVADEVPIVGATVPGWGWGMAMVAVRVGGGEVVRYCERYSVYRGWREGRGRDYK